MFQLLHPIWMLVAAGVIIPVIIHLWNRKQGRVLKVGSVSLLVRSAEQQAKSFRLQELLLLLLRCLLILLVALLLAAPVWLEQLGVNNRKGWILMEKQDLHQTYARFKPVIDSLIGRQYEFHYFHTGFTKDDLEKVLKNNPDTAEKNIPSYWSLLSALDQQVPATLPVYLFTTNTLARFTGNRPEVSMNLKWYTYTGKDSVSGWLAKAYVTTADSIRLVSATSHPSGTKYAFTHVPIASARNGAINLESGDSQLQAALQNNSPVPVDTATVNITLFTDAYAHDAAYVQSAIEAIQQFSKRKIRLSLVNSAAGIPPRQHWVFWLSDRPVPALDANNLFVYEKGKAAPAGSSIELEHAGSGEAYPALYKRIAWQPPARGQVQTIWQDGFGNPVLTLEKTPASVYHFYSRFDPSWNDLAWSDQFPQLMFSLILNSHNPVSAYDTRIMDQQQLQPVITSAGAAPAKDIFTATHDLSRAFWVAAFMVFFAERLISFRTKKERSHA